MKEFTYFDPQEFDKMLKGFPCLDKCLCSGIIEMSLKNIKIIVSEKTMEITEIPMLECKKCGKLRFSEYAKEILYGMYNELLRRGDPGIVSHPNGYRKQYAYASAAEFLYDHRDYVSIPGLKYDEEHSEPGFLTPVYFERKALLHFVSDPDYIVDMFSETYGYIGKKDPEGLYLYEWSIPLGFNSNGKLVFWLGDLDQMDKISQTILKAFIVKSDHLLTDSEFYRAQMNCVFSHPIKEMQIILNKKQFVSNIKEKYKVDLVHLDDECQQQEVNIKRPIVYTEQTISSVINAFDKILVEGINVAKLKVLYEILFPASEREGKYQKLQSIRLIKSILIRLSVGITPSLDVEKVISPLFILHELRIYFDHLLSDEKQEETKKHIATTLGASDFSEQEKIYHVEIDRLNVLFQYLVILSK